MKNILGIAALITLLGACGSQLGEQMVEVPLSYDHGSNYGDQDATGLALIDTETGQVDITVEGLPMLTDEEYEGWLAGGGDTATSTAKFNTDADGNGSSSITLGDITLRTWDRVVLTVEPNPDPSSSPDSRHSIGGDIP